MTNSSLSLVFFFCQSSEFPEIPEGPVYLDASKDAAEINASDFASQLAAIEANVKAQMDIDRKSGGLKQLQGHMWQLGYESGELLGTVYDDAYECMKKWHESGVRVCIYSSGSVAAQKLIFGYTKRGSMLPMLSAHFDTAVGYKQEVKSYQNIIEQLNVKPERMLFLTDILGEAKAAREAGAQSFVILREGNTPVDPNCGIEQFSSFHDIPVTSKQ